MNHTPGQWAVRTICDRHIWIESGSIIVAVIDGSNDPDDDRVEADARLIAAAPKLLEAGNTLAAYVYSIMNPGSIPEHVRSAMRVFENVQP